jgi:hypothetical protein
VYVSISWGHVLLIVVIFKNPSITQTMWRRMTGRQSNKLDTIR